ncbi:BlaI/MecI/CopY family transcriptional regulator [Paraburkholderia sp. BCC1886]|uniref:BlaI/MecI/CopY family transcriptional regulator n=1 Tax=Paraburkholderia sp. BCC1886 TaxID=2562670 RepID=UPI001182B343|nr:BlaI/MecI/CopY family transcriptional regulator [Paraburkholderia sp. BCC1886]
MTKATLATRPTAAELELLRVLWPISPATVKRVHQAMHEERADVTYARVLRQMQVMHAKGLLTRDESERSHIYAPAQSQNLLQTSLLKELIHKAFSGSGKALVMAALRKHVSQEEREEIRKFLHGDER